MAIWMCICAICDLDIDFKHPHDATIFRFVTAAMTVNDVHRVQRLSRSCRDYSLQETWTD